jgi:hypothetical protein
MKRTPFAEPQPGQPCNGSTGWWHATAAVSQRNTEIRDFQRAEAVSHDAKACCVINSN